MNEWFWTGCEILPPTLLLLRSRCVSLSNSWTSDRDPTQRAMGGKRSMMDYQSFFAMSQCVIKFVPVLYLHTSNTRPAEVEVCELGQLLEIGEGAYHMR